MGLNKETLPTIKFLNQPQTSAFGAYDKQTQTITLVTANRNPVDILRTLAHELYHHKQMLDGDLTATSGQTGSSIENDANAAAGIVLRTFAKEFPEYLE